MTRIEHLGRENAPDRELFMIELDRIDELPADLSLPSQYFACLLAWDATGVSDDEIRSVARKLVADGAAYFCLWGPDCKRVHDLNDSVEALREDANPDDESVIITSWHHNEPLSEAIWFVLWCTCPDEPYIDECKSTVVISVGSSEWAGEIRSALSDTRKFSGHLMAAGKKDGTV